MNLLVELQTERMTAPGKDASTTPSASSPSHIADEVLVLVNSVSKGARAVFDVQSTDNTIAVRILVPICSNLHRLLDQVITAVDLLRFSNYLSKFIIGKQIDYSALQVVVRWINGALAATPSGFESIMIQAQKVDGLVRLSSGWGFYDIWNAFLTDVIPQTDDQPLEMLEKVSSFSGNSGKKLFLRIQDTTDSALDLRSQAFQFAALCTLPAVLSHDEAKIVQDLGEKFRKVCHIQMIPVLDVKVPFSF